MTAKSRCKLKLYLSVEESAELAEAVKASGAPNRSLLILDSIQTGLMARSLAGLQGKRSRVTYFWLPTPIRREIRRLARERHVTQQNLLRHFLFTHLSQLDAKSTPPTKPRRRIKVGRMGA